MAVDFDDLPPVHESVANIPEYVDRAGHDIVAAYESDDDGSEVIAWAVEKGDWIYTVESHTPNDGAAILFDYNITNTVSNSLAEDDATEILDTNGLESGERDSVSDRAAEYVMQSVRPENATKLRYRLVEELSSTDTAFQIQTNDADVPAAFRVSRRIFPADEGFHMTEYNHSVQTVVSNGVGAIQMINHSFNFDAVIDTQTSGREQERPRYIR